jgi:hypothetical protein
VEICCSRHEDSNTASNNAKGAARIADGEANRKRSASKANFVVQEEEIYIEEA